MGKINKINKYVQQGKAASLRIFAIYERDKHIRMAAIDGLGKIVQQEDSENALLALLMEHDPDIRAAAAAAIGNAGSEYAQVQMSYFSKNERNETVLSAARSSLAKLSETVRMHSLEQACEN